MEKSTIHQNLIINFAPTGLIPTKEMTHHVPVSVEEIVEDIHRAVELGITMVHLHARDQMNGKPISNEEVYARIVEKTRKISGDLIICVSLSGRDCSEIERRIQPLFIDGHVKPDMGSLTLSSLNFNKQASVNSPKDIEIMTSLMKVRGILPELEAFDSGMVNYAKYLEKKGLLNPPHYFNLIFGNIACAQADLLHMAILINDLPANSLWSAGGVGRAQLTVNSIAIAIGGGVRVGLEDNIWYDHGRNRLSSNTELLKRVHTLAEANERRIMQPIELRKKLNLEPGNGKYGRLLS